MNTKNFLIIGLAIILTACGAGKQSATVTGLESNRQDREAILKERQKKAIKDAVDEAKRMTKEGYKTFAGDLPLAKQLENCYVVSGYVDESGFPLNIIGSSVATGGNITSAKMQATHLAKLEVAGAISSSIASLIENSIGNNEFTKDDVESINKFLQVSKELIVAEVASTHKDLEVYRELPNKNIQVQTRISYNSKQAFEASRKAIRKSMESEAKDLHKKLDDAITYDKFIKELEKSK
jgi:hypothetical protein